MLKKREYEVSFWFKQAVSVQPMGINYRLTMFPKYSQIYLNSEVQNLPKHVELIKSPKKLPSPA